MSIKRADGGGVSSAVQARQAAAEAARQAAAEAARKAAAEAARAAAAQAAREAAAQATRTAAQQSSFEPQAARNTLKLDGGTATPPASSLLTENTRDGNVNCLDRAADFVAKSTPQLQARSELVFLEDQRAGQEGQTGHVVVRQGERVLDPSNGKSYDDMQAYLREQPQYREVGTMSGTTAAKVFGTEPGSPERARALAAANVSPELQRMMVADQPPSVPPLPNPANPPDHNVSTGSAQVGPVTVNYPDQPGPVQVEFSSSLESEVKREDGFVTVTMNAETSMSASGELELKAVSVGGGVSAGNQMTYEVKMSEADFERMRRGEIPPPHPLDPNTLPDGGSVRLEQSQFTGTSMEAGISYHAAELGMSSDIREGEGMMIEMSRTGNSVQVTAGPKQFIENEGKISVGVGPVSVSGGRTDTLTNYQLRTATFDLSDPQGPGQQAYDAFRQSGRLPEQNGAGVSNALRLERVKYESQTEFGLELGPIELNAEGAANTGDMLITHHPDGSTTRSMDLVYGGDHPDLNISQRFDKDGNLVPGSENYTYKFDTDDANFRELMVYSFTGDADAAKAARDSNEPITLTMSREEMQQLQSRANDQFMAHMGLGGLMSDYDGKPLDPTTAAGLLASSPAYNEYRLAESFWGLTDGGNRPLPGDLQVGN
jgi:hypothetical protein